MNSSLSGNDYNNSKYYDYPLVVVTDTYNLIQEFEGVFLHVIKVLPSASWTDQFYFTQIKAVSLDVHVFPKSKEFSDLWESPAAVTLQNALIC